MVEEDGTVTVEVRQARKFTVRQIVDPVQLKADMGFSVADLSSAMVQQASLFAHYGTLAAKASRQVDDVKMLLEVTESKVYRKLRDEAAKEGTKLSEAMLEKSVAVHEQVISIKKALNEAKQIEANAKTAVEGFRHRRDMLVQQGLLSREEMKGEVRVGARREYEEADKAQRDRVLQQIRDRQNGASE
jgi:hypothetical protein